MRICLHYMLLPTTSAMDALWILFSLTLISICFSLGFLLWAILMCQCHCSAGAIAQAVYSSPPVSLPRPAAAERAPGLGQA